MDTIVTIEGREAIPVRAIPLLTDWQVLSPDVIANALAGNGLWYPQFVQLIAYQMQDGECKAIPAKWWERLLLPKVFGLSERIKREEADKNASRTRWHTESLSALPAGAFVWREEFEACFWRKYGPNGELIHTPGKEMSRRMPDIELDFSPFIPEQEKQKLVMEGLEAYQATRKQEQDEFKMSWNNHLKIDECKDAIARWERLEQAAPIPSEAIDAEQKLITLRQELKRLEALVSPNGAADKVESVMPKSNTLKPLNPPEFVVAQDATSDAHNFKRCALIENLAPEWPSISADLSEAGRNGLKAAAHTGNHGEWNIDRARTWAVRNGKLRKQSDAGIKMQSAWPVSKTVRHSLI